MNAERVRGEGLRLAVQADALLGPVAPAGSAVGDALNALGAAAVAVGRRLGPIGAPIAMVMSIAKLLLHPLRT